MLVFNKLSRQSILQVVSLRLNDVADRLKHRRITLDVDEDARGWLAKQGYSEVYGARAIARVVRTDVLFPLAQKLLRGTIRWVLVLLLPLGIYVMTTCHRDGDTVVIRASSEENSLLIQDNHPEDASVASEAAAKANTDLR